MSRFAGAAIGSASRGLNMTTSRVRHERRVAQRFDYQLPISLKIGTQDGEEQGFTQNLSARGAFFYTDCSIAEGQMIELTLSMPAEITLTQTMRVRCRGKVLRVVHPDKGSRIGVAAQLEGYEYLPAAAGAATEGAFTRIISLHEHRETTESDTLPVVRAMK
jgi:hypothetical protein